MLDLDEDDHDDEEYRTLPTNEQAPVEDGRGDGVVEDEAGDGEIHFFNDIDDDDGSADDIVHETDNFRYSSEPFAHTNGKGTCWAKRTELWELSESSSESESFFL